MKLVHNGAADAEVRKFGIPFYPHGDEGVDGVPVGFRDSDGIGVSPAREVVDLRRLAGEKEPDAAAGSPGSKDVHGVWRHATRPDERQAAAEPSENGSDALRPSDLRVLYVDTDDTSTTTQRKQ